MTVDLKTIDKRDYVEITCSGPYDKASLLDAIDRALKIGVDKGADTVVMDIDNIHVGGRPPDTLERYYLGEMAAKIQLGHEKRIFLAVVGKEPLIDAERFAETVAVNRGAYGKVFDEMAEALDWIKNRLPTNNS